MAGMGKRRDRTGRPVGGILWSSAKAGHMPSSPNQTPWLAAVRGLHGGGGEAWAAELVEGSWSGEAESGGVSGLSRSFASARARGFMGERPASVAIGRST
jgi:hypothetical protein